MKHILRLGAAVAFILTIPTVVFSDGSAAFSALALGLTVTVQAPVTTTAPALDELEQSWLHILSLTEQLAYSECQRLETVQKYNVTLADVVKRLEERHPGYTLDRVKGILVAKGAP